MQELLTRTQLERDAHIYPTSCVEKDFKWPDPNQVLEGGLTVAPLNISLDKPQLPTSMLLDNMSAHERPETKTTGAFLIASAIHPIRFK
jgi:hypothetical protein